MEKQSNKKKKKTDNDWDELTAELWKSEPDEMRTLQVSCKQYWSNKHEQIMRIARGSK